MRLLRFILCILSTFIGFTADVSGQAQGVCNEISKDNLIPDADCLAWMEAFPEPLVEEIPLDVETLNSYDFWHVGPQIVNLYDAPGRGIVGQIPKGFNFVRAVDTSVEGWIQTASGMWLLGSKAQVC